MTESRSGENTLVTSGHTLRYRGDLDALVCEKCQGQFANLEVADRMTCQPSEPPFRHRDGYPTTGTTGTDKALPPAVVYVLTRNGEPIRWYTSQVRAEQDLVLLMQEAVSEPDYYRVHAVPRVE